MNQKKLSLYPNSRVITDNLLYKRTGYETKLFPYYRRLVSTAAVKVAYNDGQ